MFAFKFKIVVLIHYPKVIDALVETDGIMTELDQLNKSLPQRKDRVLKLSTAPTFGGRKTSLLWPRFF